MVNSLDRQGGWAALGCWDGRHPERCAGGKACMAVAKDFAASTRGEWVTLTAAKRPEMTLDKRRHALM
jgi:hypothetical protein